MQHIRIKKQMIAFTLFLGGSVFFFGCQQEQPAQANLQLTGETMGTFYHVTLSATETCEQPEQLKQEIEDRLQILNWQMSTYLPKSEISEFNRSDSLDWFLVSTEFAEVVAQALIIAKQTQGSFDPTVAPLVNLWHFGSGESSLTIPDEEMIQQAKEKTGYQKLEVRLSPPAIRKQISDLQLDLSAIAKGDAVDRVASLLTEKGYQNFLVNIGGEAVARGEKEKGRLWRMGIEKPIEFTREIMEIVDLENLAMATSGDYRNFFIVDGEKFSHTISPFTGKPQKHSLRSVSVIAKSCSQADAYATAMMVLGTQQAKTFAQKHHLDIFLIYEQDGKLVNYQSPKFPIRETKE